MSRNRINAGHLASRLPLATSATRVDLSPSYLRDSRVREDFSPLRYDEITNYGSADPTSPQLHAKLVHIKHVAANATLREKNVYKTLVHLALCAWRVCSSIGEMRQHI